MQVYLTKLIHQVRQAKRRSREKNYSRAQLFCLFDLVTKYQLII